MPWDLDKTYSTRTAGPREALPSAHFMIQNRATQLLIPNLKTFRPSVLAPGEYWTMESHPPVVLRPFSHLAMAHLPDCLLPVRELAALQHRRLRIQVAKVNQKVNRNSIQSKSLSRPNSRQMMVKHRTTKLNPMLRNSNQHKKN